MKHKLLYVSPETMTTPLQAESFCASNIHDLGGNVIVEEEDAP